MNRRGSALIEFALAFGILFPLLYGTFQFGLAFFYYNQLTNAARAGARYAATRTYDSPTAAPSPAFRDAVRNVVVYGSPAGGAAPVVPGLTPNHIDITVRTQGAVPRTITVSVRRFSLNPLFGRIVLGQPSATFPFTGVFAPAT